MNQYRVRIVFCVGLLVAGVGLSGCPMMAEPAAFTLLVVNQAPRILTAIELRDPSTDEFVQVNTEDLVEGDIVRYVLDYDQFVNAEKAITVRGDWVSSIPGEIVTVSGFFQSTQVVAPDGAGLVFSIWTESGEIAVGYDVVEDTAKSDATSFTALFDTLR